MVEGQADCGIYAGCEQYLRFLADHSFNPFDYVNSVPRSVCRRFTSDIRNTDATFWITHDHPVMTRVETCTAAISAWGTAATLLEWDDSIPSFDKARRGAEGNKVFIFTLLATAV